MQREAMVLLQSSSRGVHAPSRVEFTDLRAPNLREASFHTLNQRWQPSLFTLHLSLLTFLKAQSRNEK